jgi:glycosyltransferase involved in cell wall biosynthesis
VATATPGIERIVDQGKTGFLVALDDLGSMEAPILTLLGDIDLRQTMEDAARRLDLSGWGAAQMVEKIDSIYEGIVRSGSGATVRENGPGGHNSASLLEPPSDSVT